MKLKALNAQIREAIGDRAKLPNAEIEIEIDYDESEHEIVIGCSGSLPDIVAVGATLAVGDDLLGIGAAAYDAGGDPDFGVGLFRNDMAQYSGRTATVGGLVLQEDGEFAAAFRDFQIP